MKSKNLIWQLRKEILGFTQSGFAVMIGTTRNTVADWERSNQRMEGISRESLSRITNATGAVLFPEPGTILCSLYCSRRFQPYLKEDFELWRKSPFGQSSDEAAKQFAAIGADSLELILIAAARARTGKIKAGLPAVWDSFTHWLGHTLEDFHLRREVEVQLLQRRETRLETRTYGQWRKNGAQIWGFKDDKRKKDDEKLTLQADAIPYWHPGQDMRKGTRWCSMMPVNAPHTGSVLITYQRKHRRSGR